MLVPTIRSLRSFTPLRRLTLAAATLAAAAFGFSTAADAVPPFNQVIVFGDSLSDVGNVNHVTKDKFGADQGYPGGDYNYSDGRFTNSSDTDPSSTTYTGVWHEQLAKRFLGLANATNSLAGGLDYAFGGATTKDGQQDRTVINNPTPFGGGQLTITIDNMGKQVDDYIGQGALNTSGLFIVWGGGNDLFDDDSAVNVTATAQRMGALVTRLAQAGARYFLVPNVPPLGAIPDYNTDASKSAELNAASSSYRDQLNGVLDSTEAALTAQGINITLARLDVYTLFLDLVANKANYGFTNIADSAQGADVTCDAYLFWDNIHPTTAGHSQIAQAAARVLQGGHPAFFQGEANLTGGDYSYLAFANGQTFGYYTYQFFPYLYSTDLGFEYFIDGKDSANGGYLYDFSMKTFLYTSPTLYPYLYNFNANAFYYYFTGTTNPRVFYNFATGQYVYSN